MNSKNSNWKFWSAGAVGILFCLTTSSTCTFAQTGETAGGGDVSETSYTSIRAKVTAWIGRNARNSEVMSALKLESKGLDGESLYQKMMSVQSVPVRFVSYVLTAEGRIPDSVPASDRVEIVVNGQSVPRTCVNHADRTPKEIVCHKEAYAMEPGSNRYKLVFHEDLGLLQIETNRGIYSDYEISSLLVSFWGPDSDGKLYDSLQSFASAGREIARITQRDSSRAIIVKAEGSVLRFFLEQYGTQRFLRFFAGARADSGFDSKKSALSFCNDSRGSARS